MDNTKWVMDSRTLKRQQIKEGKGDLQIVHLQSGTANDIEGAPVRDGYSELWGYAAMQPTESGAPFLYRRNIRIVVDGRVVLQRIGQPDYNQIPKQKAAAERGLGLVRRIQEVAIAHSPHARNEDKNFHLGMWTQQGHSAPLIWSSDLRQDDGPQATRKERQGAVMDVMVWARQYMEDHVSAYLGKRQNLIQMPDAIKEQMATRRTAYEAVCQTHHPGARKVLHPLYSMVSPFTTFSGNAHTDRSDADFSVLCNFEAGCWLVLHDLKVKVHLQADDVVVFRSNQLKHSTQPVEEDKGPGRRWGLSYYMRKAVQGEGLAQVAAQSAATARAQEADDMFQRAIAAEERGLAAAQSQEEKLRGKQSTDQS